MALDNKLTILDFTKSIRSSEINHNFSVVKGWMERERLRVGGWGIVEGFEFSYPNNDFVVHVGEGIFINKKGEEVFIDAAQISCDEPAYETITETLQVSDDGKITLKYSPYSPTGLGLIYYSPPEYSVRPSNDELTILDTTDMSTKITPVSVVDNVITVSALDWSGRTVKVTYHYCDDRIDAILINNDGVYHKEIGINSTNPSKANIDLTDMYIIGFAHWIIGRTISVEFIVDGRTYRKVYVNQNNVLYLNGKVYTEPKWIYFVEPEEPEENDVYYDKDNNTLMIYVNGEWIVMNDFTTSSLRSLKMWTADENPEDLQTFMFSDDEMDLRYVPNKNCLEIVIDQQVLMADQYTEIVQEGSKEYLASGIGFKLNEPLDRATVVQCTINHNVKNGPLTNVFQRAAIFTYENNFIYAEGNTEKLFETELSYTTNASQLEIFVNGLRLTRDAEFWELKSDGQTKPNSTDSLSSTYFKVLSNLSAGDTVTYKISRYVWSYDQLNLMMEEIENKADTALSIANANTTSIENIDKNIQDLKNDFNQQLASITAQINAMSQYRLKSEKITESDLADAIKKKLLNSFETISFNSTETITGDAKINNTTNDDIIYVNYINGSASMRLIEGENADYVITYSEDGNASIILRADLISDTATIIVDIIRFGGGN